LIAKAGVQYQMYYAVAVIATGFIFEKFPNMLRVRPVQVSPSASYYLPG
jgi:hypothetical protein